MLFVAGNLQQIGIQYTTVGKAGFITAMYIVLVPILSIFRKKAGIKIWAAVALAVAGLYILCMTDGSFSCRREICSFCCRRLHFSAHILVIDHFAPLADGVKMSCIQFFVCALLSAVCMWLFEKPDMGRFCRHGFRCCTQVFFLWRGVHTPDCRTAWHEPNGGVLNPQPGVGNFIDCWLGNIRAGALGT